jgi:serine/threonine protein kinase
MGGSVVRFPVNCPACGRRLPNDNPTPGQSQQHSLQQPLTQVKNRAPPPDNLAPPPIPEIGRVLKNRYVIESRLHHGGARSLFKAMDRSLHDLPEDNRYVAIKLLHESIAGWAESLSDLRREFLCAQALSHRSILKVYEFHWDNEAAFFTMELLEGENLSSALERSPPIPIPRSSSWAIILEIANCLAHAHARGVAHGDLKPQNIMITNSGELRILGFGLSKSAAPARPGADESPQIKLAPDYASCDLLEGQRAEPADDLFALACIAYELLAGKHPFQRRRSTEARDLGLIARRPPGLTRQQWKTLAMGLAWSSERRSISVREWVTRLMPRQTSKRRVVQSFARSIRRAGRLILPPPGAVAQIAVLLIGLIQCNSLDRISLDPQNSAVAPKATTKSPFIADPKVRNQNLPLYADLSPNPGTARPPVPKSERITYGPETFATTARYDALRIPQRGAQFKRLRMAADTYTIPSHEHFAEIHVRRAPGYGGDATFVWWTEPASAKPGIDYVPQFRSTHFLPRGRQLTSLFIRIIPNASRKHAAIFYVNIGDPRNGTAVHDLARTAILLQPST